MRVTHYSVVDCGGCVKTVCLNDGVLPADWPVSQVLGHCVAADYNKWDKFEDSAPVDTSKWLDKMNARDKKNGVKPRPEQTKADLK